MFVRSTLMAASFCIASTAIAGADAMSPGSMGSMAPVDCATAKTKMMAMSKMPMPAMPASASMDKAFYMTMKTMAERGMEMNKMEMACASSAAMKAKAEADEVHLQQLLDSAESALKVI